jgi:AcrR family transcriptional regulator
MADPVPDRRQQRRAVKQAGILAAAWELARRDGLAAITLRDLADAVDLRQPSLYAYFDSKLDLYDSMYADGYRQLLDLVTQRRYVDEPRAALSAFVADIVRFSSADVVRHQLLFQRTIPGFEPSEESFALAEEFYAIARRLWTAAGVRTRAEGDMFTALVAGLGHQQIANDPGGTRWVRVAGRTVDIFLDGLDQNRRAGARG